MEARLVRGVWKVEEIDDWGNDAPRPEKQYGGQSTIRAPFLRVFGITASLSASLLY